MLTLLPSTPEYARDDASQLVWARLRQIFGDAEGACYYKHPAIRSASNSIPEFTLMVRDHHPLIVRVLPFDLQEILSVDEKKWNLRSGSIESPIMELDDFEVGLRANIDRERSLRRLLTPRPILAMPLINEASFRRAHEVDFREVLPLWADGPLDASSLLLSRSLTEDEWRIARAVLQGARPLSRSSATPTKTASRIGEAVGLLERQIALLDHEQEKVAISMAPGPQRIRGLAGTGKTVLLAMKAANIHLHHPEKKVLFTFHTQSLYNQAKTLISRFYRNFSDTDPDWETMHIRHAWGGRNRPGVYYDLCGRQSVIPLNLVAARNLNRRVPFQACCEEALKRPIDPVYDFILVDEAQDLPKEFFRVLYKLSNPPHCVYWAYDELQSLFSLDIPRAEDLFGSGDDGAALVTLNGDDYPGEIEKDLVLHRSYRCPRLTLMVAHALGLGIYSKSGCVQMLENQSSWEAIGYQVESGNLKTGEEVLISRPSENSPNRIEELYTGAQNLIQTQSFQNRDSELQWVADSIRADVSDQAVNPDQIIVIHLDPLEANNHLAALQKLLDARGVKSTIPGLIDDSAAFAEPGKVTLTSVNRAKGNEAPIIYIIAFEAMFDFIAPVEARNRAFTATSRSKAFVRITGVGKQMQEAELEVNQVRQHYPKFKFTFPDMEVIRKLDADTAKRRRQFELARSSIREVIEVDSAVLTALAKTNRKLLEDLRDKLEDAERED